MRVAILSSGCGHIFRGAEGWSEDVAKALNEKEVNATLFKGGGKKEKSYEEIVRCMQRERKAAKNLASIIKNLSGWRIGVSSGYDIEQITFALNVLGRVKNYDIVHTKDAKTALVLQYFKKLRLIKPEIILSHGTEENNKRLKKIKYVQQLTPYYLDESRKKGIAKKSWFWLPNLVDVDVFKPMGRKRSREMFDIPGDAFVILQAAAIRRRHKRIDFAIDVIAELMKKVDKKIMYVIAGGKEEDSEELIRYGKEKLGESFRYYVDLERERMPYLYSAADLFLLTSIKETFGTVLIEAMACGIPAVASDFSAQKWIIGKGGDSVNMNDKDDVVRVLKRYVMNKNYLIKKRKMTRGWVEKNFSKEIVVDMYIKKYKEIVGK
ncbi:glycosyltransferase family 4 protein [Candidatus Woesearchaeota archaeon]|nr:glycosyltransferase family 4 protein [Candidatus Woesearchaeota archaeon]